uniref:Merozoite surface antigen 2a/b n=1 Tax=Babesia bovis TaxID=5865 RepID=Q3LUR3_BABBO|nr:merozoite surface antigen 2a/b [Babesia bovis]ABA06440.1 merozoite surface antigen 2a/b [Babesia bovis]ABA06446.1 merozoite surface antigen 2a/b [Babesia bovis]ABA06448.1 merozoite surface antigen 2a/b T-1 [Babesia bovis]
MIGKIFLLTACCCASLLSVSASEESQDTVLTTLHDEMKDVANYIKFLTKEENKDYLEGKFKEVDMPSENSLDALSAFVQILDFFKDKVPFKTSLFDEDVLRNLDLQELDSIFNSLRLRVPLIKTKLSAFNSFLNDNPPHMLTNGKVKMTEYYKKHISKEDAEVKDYETLVKFCNDFLDSESPFMRIYKDLNTYEELVKKAPGNSSSSSPSSPQETTGTQQPQAPGISQPTSPGGQPAVPNPSHADHPTKPEQSTSNLNGPSKSASFTFGGLTVATLCYFVLSAF